MVNGGQPLQPLSHRTVRDELLDGNRNQDRLMAKLMAAYEGIESGQTSSQRFLSKPRRPTRLPQVVRKKTKPKRKANAKTRRRGRGPASVATTSNDAPQSATRSQRGSTPQATTRSGPQTVAVKKESAVSRRRAESAPLWAPKRNNLLEKQAQQRALHRKFHAKPRKTSADKTLDALIKEADGLRVSLRKMGPKGRQVTLFVVLTGGTALTCIASDDTRGLKYRLALKSDPALAEKDFAEQLHVLHAIAVAMKVAEVPKQEQKERRKALKKAQPGNGWGYDLELKLDEHVMVDELQKPPILNPQAEIDAMEQEEREVQHAICVSMFRGQYELLCVLCKCSKLN